ncbi:hypothetical protein [Xanthomonas arboricola]|uniref:hypothetical protein n=1 Tax=Xanthomonas arboricola TaxID=56448 RepID=UPI0040406FE0
MSQDGFSTAVRFDRLREESYRLAEDAFREAIPNIRLGPISAEAALTADTWSALSKEHQKIGWSWVRQRKKFGPNPRRVDVAMWDGDTLLFALAIGKVSGEDMDATIHFLQANPLRPAYLMGKIGEMVVEYLFLYADLCACKRMMIDQPLPELLQFYMDLGFTNEIRKREQIIRLWQEVRS